MGLRDFFKKKNVLDERIVSKKADVDALIKKAMEDDRYSLFEFKPIIEMLQRCESINSYEKYEFFYNLINGWDSISSISRNSGEYINEEMVNHPESILGIHRAFLGNMEYNDGIPSNSNLNSIMKDGLINNGHSMQGAVVDTPSLALTVSPLDTITGFINLVGSYKSNNVIVLLEFPRDKVEDDLHFKDGSFDVYIEKDGLRYINPKYILGAIVKDDGKDCFYSREQLLNHGIVK